jgi:hypothetical protein
MHEHAWDALGIKAVDVPADAPGIEGKRLVIIAKKAHS